MTIENEPDGVENASPEANGYDYATLRMIAEHICEDAKQVRTLAYDYHGHTGYTARIGWVQIGKPAVHEPRVMMIQLSDLEESELMSLSLNPATADDEADNMPESGSEEEIGDAFRDLLTSHEEDSLVYQVLHYTQTRYLYKHGKLDEDAMMARLEGDPAAARNEATLYVLDLMMPEPEAESNDNVRVARTQYVRSGEWFGCVVVQSEETIEGEEVSKSNARIQLETDTRAYDYREFVSSDSPTVGHSLIIERSFPPLTPDGDFVTLEPEEFEDVIPKEHIGFLTQRLFEAEPEPDDYDDPDIDNLI